MEGLTAAEEDCVSRILAVPGLSRKAIAKLHHSSVLISGLDGLGAEVAKNVVLFGLRRCVLHDDRSATLLDLGANFFLREGDVGRNRAAACAPRVAELNRSVAVSALGSQLSAASLEGVGVLVTTRGGREECERLDALCREQQPPVAFIWASALGLAGQLFCDLGPQFVVADPESSIDRKASSFVASLEGAGAAAAGDGPLPSYSGGGLLLQRKEPLTLSFASLKDSIVEPEFAEPSDFGKWQRPAELHALFLELLRYRARHGGGGPVTGDEVEWAEAVRSCLTPDGEELSDELRELGFQFGRCSSYVLSPLAAALGGITAQEVIKACTGRHTPFKQWFYLDAFECLPRGCRPPPAGALAGRNAAQFAVFGSAFQQRLSKLRMFVVGAGALGCELLKGYACMGVATAADGEVTVTDDDHIEVSNLSRQFLFRNADVGKPKSSTAAAAVQFMNPAVRVTPMSTRVSEKMEGVFTPAFWCAQSMISNALDNVPARLYVDSQCARFQKPLLESGTRGTQGNVQVIVPHLTETYGEAKDGQGAEQELPVCLIHTFPYGMAAGVVPVADQIEHTLFDSGPAEAQAFLSEPGFVEAARSRGEGGSELLKKLRTIHAMLVSERPATFGDCIAFARRLFEGDGQKHGFCSRIKQLVHLYPEQHMVKSGETMTRFWSAPKRFPSALEFDGADDAQLDFVIAVANLRARTFGIEPPPGHRADREMYSAELVSWVAEPFVPRDDVNIVTTPGGEDEEAAPEAAGADNADAAADLERMLADLGPPGTGSVGGQAIELFPQTFEKDDDTNFHMDFITAASNLRARNYGIKESDKLQSKLIAGKIIPAIPTTTAMVTGLVCLELYKLVHEDKRVSKDPRKFCNSFVNLSVPLLVLSEPLAPRKELHGDMAWDRWTQWHFNAEMTLSELLAELGRRGLEVQGINSGAVSWIRLGQIPDAVLSDFFAERGDQAQLRTRSLSESTTAVTLTISATSKLRLLVDGTDATAAGVRAAFDGCFDMKPVRVGAWNVEFKTSVAAAAALGSVTSIDGTPVAVSYAPVDNLPAIELLLASGKDQLQRTITLGYSRDSQALTEPIAIEREPLAELGSPSGSPVGSPESFHSAEQGGSGGGGENDDDLSDAGFDTIVNRCDSWSDLSIAEQQAANIIWGSDAESGFPDVVYEEQRKWAELAPRAQDAAAVLMYSESHWNAERGDDSDSDASSGHSDNETTRVLGEIDAQLTSKNSLYKQTEQRAVSEGEKEPALRDASKEIRKSMPQSLNPFGALCQEMHDLNENYLKFEHGIHTRSQWNKFRVDTVGDDIHEWQVTLTPDAFSGQLKKDLTRCCQEYHGLQGVEMQFIFKRGLHPFYPPQLKLLRPRFKGGLFQALLTDRTFLEEAGAWSPFNTMLSVFTDVVSLVQKHGVVDVGSARNARDEGAYTDLENELVRLELLTKAPTVAAEQYPALYQERDALTEARAKAMVELNLGLKKKSGKKGASAKSSFRYGKEATLDMGVQEAKHKAADFLLMENIRRVVECLGAQTEMDEDEQLCCRDSCLLPLIGRQLQHLDLGSIAGVAGRGSSRLEYAQFMVRAAAICFEKPFLKAGLPSVMDGLLALAAKGSRYLAVQGAASPEKGGGVAAAAAPKDPPDITSGVFGGGAGKANDSELSLLAFFKETNRVVASCEASFEQMRSGSDGDSVALALSLSRTESDRPSPELAYVSATRSLLCQEAPGLAERYFASGAILKEPNRFNTIARELVAGSSLPCSLRSTIFLRFDPQKPYAVLLLVLLLLLLVLTSLLQFAITGPEDSPYEGGFFVFNCFCTSNYPDSNPKIDAVPDSSPKVDIVTNGGGDVRCGHGPGGFNPNLYPDGKVCLSLLGTWGKANWQPGVSTIEQIMVSIQGMILSADPIFNEPGVEATRGTDEGERQNLTANKIIRRGTLAHAMLDSLRNPRPGFEEVIAIHFRMRQTHILAAVDSWIQQAESGDWLGGSAGLTPTRTIPADAAHATGLRKLKDELVIEFAKLG